MDVAIYTRVSTHQQDTSLQHEAITKYCQALGYTITEEFSDTASGARADRPGLLALMDALRDGRARAVVVYKLDRLGRSVRDLIHIVDELRALNVEFVSVTDSIDTSTATGKLTFHVIAALAEFERELIVSRCAAGRQRAMAEGTTQFGRPRRPLDIEAIVRKAAAGVPIAHIARIHKASRPCIRARIADYKSHHPAPDPAAS